MNNGFEFIETVEYSETGRFSLFKINGELYRIWHYTDCDTKYLQKVDVETDEAIQELTNDYNFNVIIGAKFKLQIVKAE